MVWRAGVFVVREALGSPPRALATLWLAGMAAFVVTGGHRAREAWLEEHATVPPPPSLEAPDGGDAGREPIVATEGEDGGDVDDLDEFEEDDAGDDFDASELFAMQQDQGDVDAGPPDPDDLLDEMAALDDAGASGDDLAIKEDETTEDDLEALDGRDAALETDDDPASASAPTPAPARPDSKVGVFDVRATGIAAMRALTAAWPIAAGGVAPPNAAAAPSADAPVVAAARSAGVDVRPLGLASMRALDVAWPVTPWDYAPATTPASATVGATPSGDASVAVARGDEAAHRAALEVRARFSALLPPVRFRIAVRGETVALWLKEKSLFAGAESAQIAPAGDRAIARIAPILATVPTYHFRIVSPSPTLAAARAHALRRSLARHGLSPHRTEAPATGEPLVAPSNVHDGGPDRTYEMAVVFVPQRASRIARDVPRGTTDLADATAPAPVADGSTAPPPRSATPPPSRPRTRPTKAPK